jgi:dGTPase
VPWPSGAREERRYDKLAKDQRTQFQRDRDRVLYSSAFQRLAGITQIARAGEESVFYTRQQHTIKVAQIGRRLAEYCISQDNLTMFPGLASEVDPDVVEAACMIHDLGHPPFGHVGEEELNEQVTPHRFDGFEGNAQSFRIVTKLAVHKEDEDTPGIDLTRATLAACLKYPWHRQKATKERSQQGKVDAYKKWSAYETEDVDFKFATEFCSLDKMTIEAELMEWADDVAYSVHDLEDFHRCAAIPWHRLFAYEKKSEILDHVKGPPGVDIEQSYRALRSAIWDVFGEILAERYEGTRDQRWVLRNMTSNLIKLYITNVGVADDAGGYRLDIPPEIRGQVAILKQITRDYIISTPALSAQQVGYRAIIQSLFDTFYSTPTDEIPPFTPTRLRYLWPLRGDNKARFAADCVAAMSETEAVRMHARLRGLDSGSILDPIVR